MQLPVLYAGGSGRHWGRKTAFQRQYRALRYNENSSGRLFGVKAKCQLVLPGDARISQIFGQGANQVPSKAAFGQVLWRGEGAAWQLLVRHRCAMIDDPTIQPLPVYADRQLDFARTVGISVFHDVVQGLCKDNLGLAAIGFVQLAQ